MQTVSQGFTAACRAAVRMPAVKFEVRWDGSVWVDESANLESFEVRMKINAPSVELVPPGEVGQATVKLDNAGSRYSVRRTDSLLHALISGAGQMTGIAARIAAGFMVDGQAELVTIFNGVIYKHTPDTTAKQVTLDLRDRGWAYGQAKSSTALATDIFVDEWIRQNVVDAGIAEEDLVLDPSATLLRYAWRFDEDVMSEIWDAASGAAGRVYWDGQGKLHYEEPTHWALPAHQAVVWDVSESRYDNDEPDASPDDLATKIKVEWAGRAAEPIDVIYTLQDRKVVMPGKTIEFEATFDDPVLSLVEPAKKTDYEAFSAGGDRLTDSVIVSLPVLRKMAQKATVRITNNDTAKAAVIEFMQLRGMPVRGRPQEHVEVEVSPAPLAYERIRTAPRSVYYQEEAQAQAVAQALAIKCRQLRSTWTLTGVEGIPHLEMGDLITWQDRHEVTGETVAGFLIGSKLTWDPSAGFLQELTAVESANWFEYNDWYVIGETALGAHGRMWF